MLLLKSCYMNHFFLCLSLFFFLSALQELLRLFFLLHFSVMLLYVLIIIIIVQIFIYVSCFFFYNYCIVNLTFTLYLLNKTWRDSIIVTILIFLSIIFWIISLQIFIFPTQINCQMIWMITFNYQLTNLFSLKYMLWE